MKFEEYGKKEFPVVLLLHMGGLGSWRETERLKYLEKLYHLVAPILTKDDCKTEEVEIAEYFRKRHAGKVFAICSMTDSWEIANRIMQHRAVQADNTIVELGGTPGDMIASSLKELADFAVRQA